MGSIKPSSSTTCATIFLLLVTLAASSSIKPQRETTPKVNTTYHDDIRTIEEFIGSTFSPVHLPIDEKKTCFLKCYASAIESKLDPILGQSIQAKCNATSQWMSGHNELDKCIYDYMRREGRHGYPDKISSLESIDESLAEMQRHISPMRKSWVKECEPLFYEIYQKIIGRLDARTSSLIRYYTVSKKPRYKMDFSFRISNDEIGGFYNRTYYNRTQNSEFVYYFLNFDLWFDLVSRPWSYTGCNGTTANLPVLEISRETYLFVIDQLLENIQDDSTSHWSTSNADSDITQAGFIRFYRNYITVPCGRFMERTSPEVEFEFALAKYTYENAYIMDLVDIALFQREFCWRFTRPGTDIETLKVYLDLYKRDSESISVETNLTNEDPTFVRFDWVKLKRLR